MTKQTKPRLVLIDGNALIHRAYHAIPPLTTKTGELVNAVYGFATTLFKALKDLEPGYGAVTFDLAGPTFRHHEYKEYKATRVKADQSLYDQIPRVKELVSVLNIPIFEMEGFEADDIIGTLATQAEKQGVETVIVTGDLDTLQLVSPLTKVYTMKRSLNDTVIYDAAGVKEKYNLTPEMFIDFKALKGDASDNIPGVPGVGDKTAAELLNKYKNIEGIYKHLDEIPERTRLALENSREQVKQNIRLVTIVRDVPIKLILKDCLLHDYDREVASKLFQKLEFKSLLARLPETSRTSGGATGTQGELFAETARVKNLPYKCKVVTKMGQLDEMVECLRKSKGFVFDTESEHLGGKLIGISFACNEKEAWYVPVGHKIGLPPEGQLKKSEVFEKLRPILEDLHLPKGGHNLKYDYTIMRQEDVKVSPLSFDTMIAAYLLSPTSRSHSLDNVTFVEFGYEKIPLSGLIGEKKLGNLAEAPLEKVAHYSSEDAQMTYRLWKKFEPELKKNGLQVLFNELEMPIIEVLADMEIMGIKIDVEYLEKLGVDLQGRLGKLETEIYKDCGVKFNIASPKQLSDVLFNQLKLSKAEIHKGKTGISTAAGELDKLRGAHPVIEKILVYRELTKLLNTYIEALPKLLAKDGRIHTSYNVTVTSTGRLSSSNPNLQNIPIRTDLGQEIRRSFVAENGYSLVSADYSQIDLRVLAHIANDDKLIEAFRNGRDIHAETSKELGVDRRMAKVVNFSIVYGTSAYGLSQALGIEQQEAKKLIDQYFKTYPKIAEYMEKTVESAREKGYVETLYGRRRYIPEIGSNNFSVRGGAERAAINMPVQGSTADIMKMAMIKIDQYIKSLGNDKARMLLQVHDELVLEVKKTEVNKISAKTKEIMEGVGQLVVPLVCEVKAGDNWRDMEEISNL